MQLEAMKSIKNERQKLKPKITAVKVSKKPSNRLCMYGFPKIIPKPVQKSSYQVQRKDKKEPKIKTVSHTFFSFIYISKHQQNEIAYFMA